ncbi:ABC transporter substrate-binding protein [Candidatus Puniceispirillum marinum]|uniref:Branched-chain amino acid ABC transporter, periplasmic branched-chain amino acid-binding protein, putative n=1 Tax=Puniceispirillum marinum (strain IMCC1322) TaxID=488538 RepID=D5BMG0_PUNMI|nr:ABC transporter substrate-binding protein [Candidatus Puniceispirillum marinum]ADE40003.1 branched-chain amino acid ABC transporter, periplasmic branched-chain amino acid-binding protein, putative [Candidatus Puniceispirillum marinum IMCC1322]
MTNHSSASRRQFLKTIGAGGVGSAALLASANTATALGGEPIVIGAPLPLTGLVAADGIEFRNGLEMAVEEINAIGGILGHPLELAIEDTQSQGDDVIASAGQRLIDRSNASVLISGYNLGSSTALPVVAADASVIYMHADTVVAHNELIKSDPETFWGSFQYDPAEIYYGIAYLQYMRKLIDDGDFKPANNRIAVITGPIAYSINIANAIRDGAADYGFEVSLFESVQAPTSEWGPTLAKIRQNPPAMIAVTHFFPQDQAQFMQQFVNDPTDSLIYMQYGASLAAFRDIAGDASEGVLYATTIGALQDEIGNDFTARYLDAFGNNASSNGGGQTYSALWAYAVAAALAGGAGQPYEEEQNRKIAERLGKLIYRSPVGTIRIDPETLSAYSYPGDTNDPSLGMPHIFSQIQNKAENGYIIAPAPYDVARFQQPDWS